jgi:hypothetical protein
MTVSSGNGPDVKMTVTLCSVVDKYQLPGCMVSYLETVILIYCCGSLKYWQPKWLVVRCSYLAYFEISELISHTSLVLYEVVI